MSAPTDTIHLTELVDEFFNAYNNVDEAKLAELLAEDVHWEHHNRFAGDGRDGLIDSIRRIAAVNPGRTFSPPARVAEVGSVVYREHTWSGTAIDTLEGFDWKVGEPRTSEVMSVCVIRDGQIVEWSDYA